MNNGIIVPNSHRKHYKGNEYVILTLSVHTETGEEMVVYQDISSPEKVWVRPVAMFFEKVMIDGREVERFTQISPNPSLSRGE